MARASALWAGRELRNRWRALVLLGVIAGLAAGVVLAAVAGARRTATAYDRYRVAVRAPDAIVFGTQIGAFGADYSTVRALPEIVAAGEFALAPIGVNTPRIGALPPNDDQLYNTVSRPLVREGRLPDPRRDDEIVINLDAQRLFGLDVGDTITIDTVTSTDAFFSGETSGGPQIEATVVGVGNSFMDEVFFGGGEEGGFTASPALLANRPEIPRAGNLVVRLRPGTDVARFSDRAERAFRAANAELLAEAGASDADIPVRDLAEDRKRFIHGTDLERTALLLFAAAAALAATVLVGQAVARSVYAMADGVPALRVLGMTRTQMVAGLIAPAMLTAVVAGAGAMASAVALSSRFPVGLARRLDPDLGADADWAVLAPGAAATLLLVIGAAALAGLRATRARASERGARVPAVVGAIRNAAPLPVGIGAGLALDPGRGRRTVPVRPAIAGGVAGVLGIVGALGLVKGVDDAVADPARAGQTWDALVRPEIAELDPEAIEAAARELTAAVEAHPDLEASASVLHVGVDVEGDGLPLYAITPIEGELSFVVLEGRPPVAATEAALGPASLAALRRSVGDAVTIGGRRVTVVGEALLPQTPHSSFDQGVWMTPAGAEAVGAADAPFGPELFVRGRDGIAARDLVTRLERLSPDVEASSIPQDVVLLTNVRSVPRALAAFLVLLAVAALGHALVTTVRRRRHDLAVLRALGFRPAQARAAIAWQATTVGIVALVLGVPLGVAAGRTAWRLTAEATPLLYVGPVAAAAIALTVPGAILVANALAAWPARRAGRIRPAVVLRTE